MPADVQDHAPDGATTAALTALLRPLGEVTGLTRLTGGFFATTYRAELADGGRVVAKTAPADTDRLLTYERDLVRTEALVYRLAEPHPGLLMPRVLLTDFSRTLLPTDVVVASHARGVPVGDLPDLAERTAAGREHRLGALMAELHTLHGDRFGYPDPGTALRGGTWPEAFGAMVEAVLADADRWGVDVHAAEVRAALARHRGALAEVTGPSLVHADLWPGNLFVDPRTGELTDVIDAERAFWGDPLFDLVGADPFATGEPPAAVVAGYVAAGGRLPLGTPSGRRRLAFCRLYMALIMLVEVRPRGYAGDWLVEHTRRLDALFAAAMAELA